MKPYYPAFLDLTKKACIVIGGGNVANRKIESLLKAEAVITVISPEITSEIKELETKKKIKLINRAYQKGDTKGYFLVIIATSNPVVNAKIYKEVDHLTQLVNIVDSPDLCTFIVPSSLKRGHLHIAISTHGASPGLSKKIRKDLENLYSEDYSQYTEFLAELRNWILKQNTEERIRKDYFNCLLEEIWFNKVKLNGTNNAVADFKAMFKKEFNHIE